MAPHARNRVVGRSVDHRVGDCLVVVLRDTEKIAREQAITRKTTVVEEVHWRQFRRHDWFPNSQDSLSRLKAGERFFLLFVQL